MVTHTNYWSYSNDPKLYVKGLQCDRCPFPSTVHAVCGRMNRFGRWCARHDLTPPNLFCLFLFVTEKACGGRLAPCRENFQLSIDQLILECEEAQSLGIGGVMLFGLPESKDEEASGAYAEAGIVQRALRALKIALPMLLVITDVCNCEYTSHGHCGKVVNGDVDNDATLGVAGRLRPFLMRARAPISLRLPT